MHIHIITWSQLNNPSFTAVCTKQNVGREWHATVCYHTSIGYEVCRSVSLCQKWELFFVEPELKSQWTVFVG